MFRQVSELIVESEQWKEALSNVRLSKTGSRITPLRMLIRKFPDVAEKVFNKCVKTNGRGPEDRNFSATFIYEFLDDTYTSQHQQSADQGQPEGGKELGGEKATLVDYASSAFASKRIGE